MEVIAKLHSIDGDMVELLSKDMRYLFGVMHIDNFSISSTTHDEFDEFEGRLSNGEELTLKIEIVGD